MTSSGTDPPPVDNRPINRKRRIDPTSDKDLLLLRLIRSKKPWARPLGMVTDAWDEVSVSLGQELGESTPSRSSRACKKRMYDLLRTHKNDKLDRLNDPGTAEELAEKARLLTEIQNSINDHKLKKRKKTFKIAADAELPESRENSLSEMDVTLNDPDGFVSSPTSSCSIATTSKSDQVLEAFAEYFSIESNAVQLENRKLEAELADRRLALEEQKLAFQREVLAFKKRMLDEEARRQAEEARRRAADKIRHDQHTAMMRFIDQMLTKITGTSK